MHRREAPAGRARRLCALAPATLAGVLLALSLQSARATDLIEAWQAAQQHDPEFSAARAAHEAGQARRSQAHALWRPSVQFSGTAGGTNSDTAITGARFSAPGFGQSDNVAFGTSVDGGRTTRWALSARQPLLSGERRAKAVSSKWRPRWPISNGKPRSSR